MPREIAAAAGGASPINMQINEPIGPDYQSRAADSAAGDSFHASAATAAVIFGIISFTRTRVSAKAMGPEAKLFWYLYRIIKLALARRKAAFAQERV